MRATKGVGIWIGGSQRQIESMFMHSSHYGSLQHHVAKCFILCAGPHHSAYGSECIGNSNALIWLLKSSRTHLHIYGARNSGPVHFQGMPCHAMPSVKISWWFWTSCSSLSIPKSGYLEMSLNFDSFMQYTWLEWEMLCAQHIDCKLCNSALHVILAGAPGVAWDS